VNVTGGVIWLTGIPGSGRTTIGHAVAARLSDRGHLVEVIDETRGNPGIWEDMAFPWVEGIRNMWRIFEVCRILARHGVWSVVCLVSPHRGVREEMRQKAKELGMPFVEVFIGCPPSVAMSRNPREIFPKPSAEGEPDFTGVAYPYQIPLEPDVAVDGEADPVDKSARHIVMTAMRDETA
jgi:adenylylsulfate kinase